jgi:hypothetical protein
MTGARQTSFRIAAIELETEESRRRIRLILLIARIPFDIHERRKHSRDPTSARTKGNAVASHQYFSLFTGQGISVAFACPQAKIYTHSWNSRPRPAVPWYPVSRRETPHARSSDRPRTKKSMSDLRGPHEDMQGQCRMRGARVSMCQLRSVAERRKCTFHPCCCSCCPGAGELQ